MGLDEGVVDSDDLDLGVGNTMKRVNRGSWSEAISNLRIAEDLRDS